jgi:hypothetical protein
MIKNKNGGDVVSGLKKFGDKVGIKFKNWHLYKHNYTGQLA